jgi:HD-like signal output (HDOD) protein
MYPPPTPQRQINQADVQKLIGTIKIPPQPEIVRTLIEERGKDEPNINRIIQLIGKDVGLAAAVLKTVNSPFYGLRNKVASIQQAVSLLGLKNIGTLVMGLALRTSVKVDGIERFWESASRSAQLAHLLARRLALSQTQEVHLYVLFQDAAMPLLLQNISDYRQTMKDLAGLDWCHVTELEDERHQTNHAVVGGLLASNWGLPDSIRDAITYHHDISALRDARLPSEVMNLIAIGHIAEKLESMISNSLNDCEWDIFGKTCLQYLGLGEDELLELKDAAKDFFGIGEF